MNFLRLSRCFRVFRVQKKGFTYFLNSGLLNLFALFLGAFPAYSAGQITQNGIEKQPLQSRISPPAGRAELLEAILWPDLRSEFLDEGKAGGKIPAQVSFDERVKVTGPIFAEDAMNVPISVSAQGIAEVQQIMVLVDRNPIRKVLEYFPESALPNVSFRFKLEQGSLVRALVKTSNGWLMGGTFVNASGGGCTVSGATRADGTWSQTLGQVSGRLFDSPASSSAIAQTSAAPSNSRLRFRVMHPMDTGLVAGVPAFHLNKLQVSDLATGKLLLRMNLYEPVSENPVFSFDFPGVLKSQLQLSASDNNGNRVSSRIE